MKKFSELSEEILAYELAIQIQEGNITEEEVQDLHEVLPALALAGKIIGAGLTAYSGYQAAKNLRSMKKGDNCFFYHSNIGKEIIGIVEVIKEAFIDPTDSKKRFVAVKVKFKKN